MTRPAPRSSARSSPRSRSRAPKSTKDGSRPTCSSSTGRVAGVMAIDGPTETRRPRATHTVIATGWRGSVLCGHHESAAVHRRRRRDGAASRGRGRRRRVHAVPSHRAPPPVDAAAAPLRSIARRGRDPARRATASHSWPRSTRSPTSRHATSWPRRSAGDSTSAGSITCGSMPPVSMSFPARFPTIWAGLPVRRARPHTRLAAGRACGALPLRRGLHRSRRRHDASRTLGMRRGGVHRRARREPPGVELVARGSRVRGARGRGDRPRQGRARRHRCAARTWRPEHASAWPPAAPAPGARDPRGAPADHDPRRRRRCGARRASSAPRPRSPAWFPTDIEERNLHAVSTRRSCARPPARRESRGTHTRSDFPRAVTRRSSGVSCSPARRRPSSCRCSPRAGTEPSR